MSFTIVSYFIKDRVDFWLNSIRSWINLKEIPIINWSLFVDSDKKSEKKIAKFPLTIEFKSKKALNIQTNVESHFLNAWLSLDLDGFGLLKVDGKIISGIDGNHHEFKLPVKRHSKIDISIEFFPTSAIENGLKTVNIREISIFEKDLKMERLFFDLQALYEVTKQPLVDSQIVKYLENELEKALSPIYNLPPDKKGWQSYLERNRDRADLRGVAKLLVESNGNEGLVNTSRAEKTRVRAEVQRRLEQIYLSIPKMYPRQPGTMLFVGYSHLDLAWLWRLSETQKKMLVTIASQVNLLNMFPNWSYVVTSPLSWEILRENSPPLYRDFVSLSKQGRIEQIDSFYVEIEGQMPHPEGVIRQMILGNKFSETYTRKHSGIAFLPDSFGYSRGLCTLMSAGGIDLFFTAKLYYNDTSMLPHRDFNWVGQDDSSVRTHIFGVKGTAFNGTAELSNIMSAWNFYASNGGSETFLYTFGFGDGGGGPTYEMLMRIERYKRLTFLPEIITGDLTYFRNRPVEHLPSVKDDLYLCYNRGIYTTDSLIKQGVKFTEKKLIAAEIWSNWILGGMENNFEPAWKLLLLQHFHDIMAGTVIEEVSRDVDVDLKKVNASIRELEKSVNSYFQFKGGAFKKVIVLSRSLLFSERFSFVVESSLDIDLVRENRIIRGTRISPNEILFVDQELPAFGVFFYKFEKVEDKVFNRTSSISLKPDSLTIPLENGQITIDSSGISSIKIGPTEMLSEPARTHIYWHHPDRNDAWALDSEYPKHEISFSTSNLTVVHKSEQLFVVSITRKCTYVDIEERITVNRLLPYIEIKISPKFRSHHILTRYEAFVTFDLEKVISDGMNGLIDQPITDQPFKDLDKFEWCAHSFTDAVGSDHGIALFNDTSYGYSVQSQKISTSLFTTPLYPNPFSEIDSKPIRVGLMIHSGDLAPETIYGYASSFSISPLVLQASTVPKKFAEKSNYSLLYGLPQNIAILGVKAGNKGGIMIHLEEISGKSGNSLVTPDIDFSSAALANIKTEEQFKKLKIQASKNGRNSFMLDYSPHAIMGVHLESKLTGREKEKETE